MLKAFVQYRCDREPRSDRRDQVLETGNRVWESWARDGEFQSDGIGGLISIPVRVLATLPETQKRVAEALGVPVSVGIGMSAGAARQALESVQGSGGGLRMAESQALQKAEDPEDPGLTTEDANRFFDQNHWNPEILSRISGHRIAAALHSTYLPPARDWESLFSNPNLASVDLRDIGNRSLTAGRRIAQYSPDPKVVADILKDQETNYVNGTGSYTALLIDALKSKTPNPHVMEAGLQEGLFDEVASSPAAPPEILQTVWDSSGDEDFVSNSLAHNPRTPEPILRALSAEAMKNRHQSQPTQNAAALVHNPSLPPDLLHQYLTQGAEAISVPAAQRPDLPESAMLHFFENPVHGGQSQARAILSRPDITDKVWESAADCKFNNIRYPALTAPKLPDHIFHKVLRSGDSYDLGVVLSQSRVTSSHLQVVMDRPDCNASLAGLVARNRAVAPEQTVKIWRDYPAARSTVYHNGQRLGPEHLTEMHRVAKTPEDLEFLSQHPETPGPVLAAMAKEDGADFAAERHIARHPNTPVDTLIHLTKSPYESVLVALGGNTNLPPDHLPDLVQKSGRLDIITERPDFPPQVLRKWTLDEGVDDQIRKVCAVHPGLPAGTLQELLDSPPSVFGNANNNSQVLLYVAKEKNHLPPEFLRGLYHSNHAKDSHWGDDIAENVVRRSDCPEDVVRHGLNHPNPAVQAEARVNIQTLDPDTLFDTRVQVGFDTAKLRQARDLIEASGKPSLPPRALPAGDWSVGRLPDGQISAKLLQEAIDAKPKTTYNISHSTYDEAQMDDPEKEDKVFQLAMTTDMAKRLRAAGAWDTYGELLDVSSAHPRHNTHGLGWIRYRGTPGSEIHVQEIQADFGPNDNPHNHTERKLRHWTQKVAEQPGRRHEDILEIAKEKHEEALERFPPEHTKAIDDICWGGRNASEVLLEAFHQYLRDQGHVGKPVSIHSMEGKPLVDANPPRFGYEDLPKRQGYQPSTYGTLKVHTGEKLMAAKPRTWQQNLKKAEPGEEPANSPSAGGGFQPEQQPEDPGASESGTPQDLHQTLGALADEQGGVDAEQQAQGQAQDQAQAQGDSMESQVLKALQVFQAKKQELEALKDQDPELYQGLVAMIQSMVAMARQVMGGGQVQKSEKIETEPQDRLPAGSQLSKDRLPGGPQDDIPVSEFSPAGIQAGTAEEMEHTNDPGIASEVARDHLVEDPDHYDKAEKKDCKHFFGKSNRCLKCKAEKTEKAQLEAGKTGRHDLELPVGSQKDSSASGTRNVGQIKVQGADGKEKWRSVRAGLVMDPEGNPVSSRNPGG